MKYIITFLLLLPVCAAAQWRYLGYGNPDATGSIGKAPLAFGVHDHHIFVSDPENGILREDSPYNWTSANAGIDFSQGRVTSFASLGHWLFAGTTNTDGSYGPSFGTNNDGAQWTETGGSPVCTNGTYLYGCSISSVYISKDTAKSWKIVGCPKYSSFGASGACILVGTASGIYRSTDSGTNWLLTSAPSDLSLSAFAIVGTKFFAGKTSGGMYRSDDSGSNWVPMNVAGRSVNALAASDSFLFAGTDSGIYISSDFGASWRNVTDNIKARSGFNPDVMLLAVVDTLVYAEVEQGESHDVWRCVTDRPIAEMTSNEAVASLPKTNDTTAIFPNPTQAMVTIRSTRVIDGIRVLNVLGSGVLSTEQRVPSDITLDLSKLPSGTYFIEIQTSEGAELRKVVKE